MEDFGQVSLGTTFKMKRSSISYQTCREKLIYMYGERMNIMGTTKIFPDLGLADNKLIYVRRKEQKSSTGEEVSQVSSIHHRLPLSDTSKYHQSLAQSPHT